MNQQNVPNTNQHGGEPAPRCLITGALGFVGLHLVTRLIESGSEVYGLGRHEPGNELPLQFGPFALDKSVPEWPGAVKYKSQTASFIYFECALEDPEHIKLLISRIRPTTIYHLAAQSSAALSFTNPRDTFDSNLIGTLNLLDAVRDYGETHQPVIISVGSCEEYGAHPAKNGPLSEQTIINPISPYGVSKAAQTLLCRQYVHSYGLKIVPVRSFSHTGPGQSSRFVFPSFAHQIAAAETGFGSAEIAVGDLSPVRDFLDVRDVVAAYGCLAKIGDFGVIYNVSSGSPLTIQDGLDILVSKARCAISVRKDPARCRPSDMPYMVGDSSRLKNTTGWKPEINIDQTLQALLDEARKEFS